MPNIMQGSKTRYAYIYFDSLDTVFDFSEDLSHIIAFVFKDIIVCQLTKNDTLLRI